MFKKSWRKLKNYLAPIESKTSPPLPKVPDRESIMNDSFLRSIYNSPALEQERLDRQNRQAMEIARFELDKEALNLNLKAQHRSMIATLIAALVALLVGIAAVLIAVFK